METIDFSIVIGCYFEEKSIEEFYTRLKRTLEETGRSYELLFVNDGSTDGTLDHLRAIFERDEHVTAVVDLMKNTGQANAKTPGVALAKGRAIVLIDSDLQLDPEELPSLIEQYDAGADIVTGYRADRTDPVARTLPSKLANAIMRKATGTNLRDFGCTFKIYDGRLVRAFEFGPFKPWRPVPVISMAGRIAEVPVSHHARRYGKSGWTFKKLFAYNMESLVNVSDRPFQALSMLCVALALLLLLRVVGAFFLPQQVLPQVTNGLLLNATAISLLFTLAVLSLIGEFVIRNFGMLQQKPAYVVRELLRR